MLLIFFPACLDLNTTQPKDNPLPHDVPGRLWENVGAYSFSLNNKHCLCNLDYRTKHLVIKQMEGFIAHNLIKYVYELLHEIGILSFF